MRLKEAKYGSVAMVPRDIEDNNLVAQRFKGALVVGQRKAVLLDLRSCDVGTFPIWRRQKEGMTSLRN